MYVAAALFDTYIKVGACSDVQTRIYSINNQGYAGQCDWRLVAYAWVDQTSPFERAVYNSISGRPVQFGYASYVSSERSREAKIGCLEDAVEVFQKLANEYQVSEFNVVSYLSEKYMPFPVASLVLSSTTRPVASTNHWNN